MFKTAQTHEIESRDFEFGIHMGKPYIDEYEKEAFTFRPMDDLDEQWKLDFRNPTTSSESKVIKKHGKSLTNLKSTKTTADLKSTKTTDLQTIRKAASNFVIKIGQDVMDKSKKVFTELIEKGSENVDKRFVRNLLHKLDKSPLRWNSRSFLEYQGSLVSYVKMTDSRITDLDVYDIIRYLLIAYQPMDNNDFPNAKVNKGKIQSLIHMTRDFDDSHPKKWTDKRYDLLVGTRDVYKKLIYFDDFLMIWFKYIRDEDFEKFSNFDIIVKKIIDHILTELCQFFTTPYIVFKYEDDSFYDRLKNVINSIFRVMEEYSEKFICRPQIDDFLLDTQIENQYILIKKLDVEKDIRKKFDLIVPSTEDIMKGLEDGNFIEKKRIL